MFNQMRRRYYTSFYMLHVEIRLYCINRPTRMLDNFSSNGTSQCICCDCKIKHFIYGVWCWRECLSFERLCLSHTGWAPFPSSSRPGWCVFLPACRRKLREVQRQLGFYIMDSQGRKVVVCDNGTGVSFTASAWHTINPWLALDGVGLSNDLLKQEVGLSASKLASVNWVGS